MTMRHPGRVKILLVTATVLATLALAGCDDGPSESADPSFLDSVAPTAVVKGRLLQTDSTGKNPTPVAGDVVLTGPNGATVSGPAKEDGTFEISVLPDVYQVTGGAPQPDGGTAACKAKATSTTVAAAAPTVVDVFCVVGF